MKKIERMRGVAYIIEHGDVVYVGNPDGDDWIAIEWRTVSSLGADRPERVTVTVRGQRSIVVLPHGGNSIGIELTSDPY